MFKGTSGRTLNSSNSGLHSALEIFYWNIEREISLKAIQMQTSKEKRETFILQRKQAAALRDKLQTAEEDSPQIRIGLSGARKVPKSQIPWGEQPVLEFMSFN